MVWEVDGAIVLFRYFVVTLYLCCYTMPCSCTRVMVWLFGAVMTWRVAGVIFWLFCYAMMLWFAGYGSMVLLYQWCNYIPVLWFCGAMMQ